LFPPDLPFVGDWYFWFRFGLLADAGYLPEPLAHYRIHGASLTSQFFGPRAWDRVIQYLKLHLAMRDLAGDLDGFLEEITLGLKSDMSQFLQVWMYHPHSRPSMLEALSGDLAVSTVPLRDRDFRPLLAQLLEKSATELLFQAITQGKPRLGLKSLLLRTQLPKILAAVREGK
jgi:hypothetical protein